MTNIIGDISNGISNVTNGISNVTNGISNLSNPITPNSIPASKVKVSASPKYSRSKLQDIFNDTTQTPMPDWRWLVSFPDIVDAYGVSFPGASIIAEQVVLPASYIINSRGVWLGGRNRYFPDYADCEESSMVLFETQNMDALKYLKAWQSLVYSKEGYYGVKGDYAKNIQVWLYSIYDHTTPAAQFTIYKSWVKNVNPYSLAGTGSGRLQTHVNFATDDNNIIYDSTTVASVTVSSAMGAFANAQKSLVSYATGQISNITNGLSTSIFGGP